MTKQKLPLVNVSVIITDDCIYDSIVKVTESTFDGRAYLLISYANGESIAIRSGDVVSIRYKPKESTIKTQKDVYEAWKDCRLVEV